MADTIAPPRQAPELELLAVARRQRLSREEVRLAVVVAAPLLSEAEVERAVEAILVAAAGGSVREGAAGR